MADGDMLAERSDDAGMEPSAMSTECEAAENNDDEPEQRGRAAVISDMALAILLVAILVALAVAAVAMVVRLFAGGPIDPSTNPLNNIFASRTVLAATRLVLMVAAAYAIISMIALIREKRWLVGMGLFRSDERVSAVQAMDKETRALDQALVEAEAEIERLDNELAEAVDALTKMGEAYDDALDYILRLERGGESDPGVAES